MAERPEHMNEDQAKAAVEAILANLEPDSPNRLLQLTADDACWYCHLSPEGLDQEQRMAWETDFLRVAESLGFQGVFPYFAPQSLIEDLWNVRPHSASEGAKTVDPSLGLKVNKQAIPMVDRVIAVASGKGGVGKSTVSTALALGLAERGGKVGLLDADIYGPSAKKMFGLAGNGAVSERNFLVPEEKHGVKVVTYAFFSDEAHPVLWRGPLIAKGIQQLCYQVEWGELDYLVIDLPPGTGDIQLQILEKVPLSGAVIVTTAQDVALIDAHKAFSMFEKMGTEVIGVVANMTQHRCGHCHQTSDMFGNAGVQLFAKERQTRILAELPFNPELTASCDRGDAEGFKREPELARLVDQVAEWAPTYHTIH